MDLGLALVYTFIHIVYSTCIHNVLIHIHICIVIILIVIKTDVIEVFAIKAINMTLGMAKDMSMIVRMMMIIVIIVVTTMRVIMSTVLLLCIRVCIFICMYIYLHTDVNLYAYILTTTCISLCVGILI